MVWGMIPPWTMGDYKSSSYTTHNCRIETVKESRLYSAPLATGKRCVILCEGYYEWKTTVGKHKQPCFIYTTQSHGLKAENESHWNNGKWSKSQGWVGPSLTYLAGLFSSYESKKDSVSILSSTIITMSSSSAVSHIHHRMPAILSTPQQIKDWLNAEDVDMKEAINILEASESVKWHEVSIDVNSSKNKLPSCNKPVDTKKQGGKQMSLTCFFKKPIKYEDENRGNPPKKTKHN
ncbi:abasic site processing protein HMCES isoform X2 [Halyomorpha halys]